MGPPDSMKTYGLRGASREKGQTNRRVRKAFPVFDQLFAKGNENHTSKRGKKGLWNDSSDLFDLKVKGRKPLKDVNHLLNSIEGSLLSSANDTFDNFCSKEKTNKVAGNVSTGVNMEISGPENIYSNSLSHSSSTNDSCFLYQSMFKHSLKKIPVQSVKVTEEKAWSNPWNESEALLVSKNENCSNLERHASEGLIDSRKEVEQVIHNLSNTKAVSCSDQILRVANLPSLEENEAKEVLVQEMRTPLSTLKSKKRIQSKGTGQCPSVDLNHKHSRKILTSTPSLTSHGCFSSSLTSRHLLGSLLEGALSPVPKDLIDDVFVSSPELSENASVPFQKISKSSSSGSSYESAVASQSGHEPVKDEHSLTPKGNRRPAVEGRNQLCSDIDKKTTSCFHSDGTSKTGFHCNVKNSSVDLFASLDESGASECLKKTKDSVAEKIEIHENFDVSVVLRNFTRRRRCNLKTFLQNTKRNSSKVKLQVTNQNSRCSRASSRQSCNKSSRTSRPSFNCSRIRTSAVFRKYKKRRQNPEVLSSEANILCNNNSKLHTYRKSRQCQQIQKMASSQTPNSIYQENSKLQPEKGSCSDERNVDTHQRFRNEHYLRLLKHNGVSIENLDTEENCSTDKDSDVNETSVWTSATCRVEQSPDYATSIKHDCPESLSSNLSCLEYVKESNSELTCPASSSSEDYFWSGKSYSHLESDHVFASSHLDSRNASNSCSVFSKSKLLTETKGTKTKSILCSQTKSFVNKDLNSISHHTPLAKYSAAKVSIPPSYSIVSMTQSMADLQVQDECKMLPNIPRTRIKLSDIHASASVAHNRRQTFPRRSNLLLANRQRLSTSRRYGERRSSRRSMLQIGILPGKTLSKAVLDPKQHVLELCTQKTPVPIQECLTPSRLKFSKKIGEGAFGEVFMTRRNPDSMDGASVMKIMPIEGDFEVNGEHQKTFAEIVSEIIISKELSGLREDKRGRNWCENFVHVLSSWCVFGSYPPALLDMWDQFNAEKGSENDRPDLFPDTQLYIVLEFGHGGQDLESFVFNNAGQALAIFLQIAYSLAVSEQELEFEHRDLHWGNVLVSVTSAKMMEFRVAGKTYKLKTQGVKATVIDFTLSRLRAPDCVVFNNLSEDPALFTSEGDYQFEIYRLMKKATKNDWEKFNPYTNVLWLHYILDKMESDCYYKNIKTKVHRENLKEIRQLKSSMLDSLSATDFVLKREE